MEIVHTAAISLADKLENSKSVGGTRIINGYKPLQMHSHAHASDLMGHYVITRGVCFHV